MAKSEIIFDTQFNMAIDTPLFDEIKKRAKSQRRSLSEIARSMFDKCIEVEDKIIEDIYKKDELDPEDVKQVKELHVDFDEFMKDWLESIEARKELSEDK